MAEARSTDRGESPRYAENQMTEQQTVRERLHEVALERDLKTLHRAGLPAQPDPGGHPSTSRLRR